MNLVGFVLHPDDGMRYERMPKIIAKIVVHALLFVVAMVVFFLGLGIGLQVNPTVGTILWGVAAVIAILNLLLIFLTSWGEDEKGTR